MIFRLKKKFNRERATNSPSIILCTILLINLFTNFGLAFSNDFSYPIEKGTKLYRVEIFNKTLWENVISEDFGPERWFPGESNISGSKNKQVVGSWINEKYSNWYFFEEFFIPSDYLNNLRNFGLDSNFVDDLYENTYQVIRGRWYIWDFINITNLNFKRATNVSLADINQYFYIFKKPSDLYILYNNYNKYARSVNNDPRIRSINSTLPIYGKNEFMEHLVLKRYILFPKPIVRYLNSIISILDLDKFTIDDNTLIIHKRGEKSYTFEITYKGDCFPSKYNLRDAEGKVFFNITNIRYRWILYIFLSFMLIGLSVLGIIGYLSRKKFKKITIN